MREGGATPATIAMVAGRARVGLDADGLEAIASGPDVVKCGVRDLAPLAARGGHGATTVAATAHLAARAGIRLFATGGLGGVHRGARESWDESADLETLARTPVAVVCSGVKSILDVAATLERLETLGVTVLGYGSDRFPGFYLEDSGHPVAWRVDSPEEVARVLSAQAELGTAGSGVVVANPLPAAEGLAPEEHDRVLAAGLEAAERAGAAGKDVTPFLLDHFHRETAGASLEANVRLVLRNAGARRSHRRGARGVTRVVVLGDVMVDVVAQLAAPLAHASDAPARIGFHGGGSAANTAAWLAAAGARPVLVGRVGDDERGRDAERLLRAAGVETRLARRRRATDRHLHRAGGRRRRADDGARRRGERRPRVRRPASELLEPGGHLHVGGYSLLREGSRPAAMDGDRAGARGRHGRVGRSVVGRAARAGVPGLGGGRGAAAARTSSRPAR